MPRVDHQFAVQLSQKLVRRQTTDVRQNKMPTYLLMSLCFTMSLSSNRQQVTLVSNCKNRSLSNAGDLLHYASLTCNTTQPWHTAQ